MKHILQDTLARRLFLLICLCLVVSHLVAFSVSTRLMRGHFTADGSALPPLPPLPPLATLPPTPGLPGGPPAAHAAGPDVQGRYGPAREGGAQAAPPALPMPALLADYGIRLLLMALAAWYGARWLSAPMSRLSAAALTLGPALGRSQAPPRMEEGRGTVEVRAAAEVFNQMAARLDLQFRSRGMLMAAISHDLRSPLTRIRMNLESLQGHAAAARCIEDVREMNALIDTAIDAFRRDAPEEAVQHTDVLALVQALADDCTAVGQSVRVGGQPLIAPVRTQALRRALSNLVGNALRYAGSVELTVVELDGPRILVEDRGPGIPEHLLQSVLEPFVRLEPSRNRQTGGYGLGLHIARELLEAQGASLTLANRPGGGLRAEIRLAPG